jgi:hypothetical protein
MPVSFLDLQLALEFVSSGGTGENEAYLDRRSGKIYWHAEFGYNDEELPDDIDDKKYILIPHKRELDLGKPLVLDFAREFLPDETGDDADRCRGATERAEIGTGDAARGLIRHVAKQLTTPRNTMNRIARWRGSTPFAAPKPADVALMSVIGWRLPPHGVPRL